MDTCQIYHIRDLDELRLKIKNEMCKSSKSHLSQLKNRYSSNLECESSFEEKSDKLFTYDRILEKVKEQTLSGNEVCLDRYSLQCLIEKVTNIIGKNCMVELCNYDIDTSREEEWVMKYPFCRTYEDWEKWAKYFAGKLNLELKSDTEQLNNIILEVTRETISPNVLLAISAYTEVRDNLNVEVSRSDEQIRLDFEILMEKVSGFDLDLKIYSELIKNHKLSFDIVKTVYDEGLRLNSDSGGCYLVTPLSSYNLNQLSGDIDPSYLSRFGMTTTINRKDLLQDYR